MKTTMLLSASLVLVAGCSGGLALRDAKTYADDLRPALDAKSNDIRTCYDGVLAATPGAAGKVTVKFDVVQDGEPNAGTVQNVAVDPAGTTAPAPVADCVTKTIKGVAIKAPADSHKGEGSWTWEFTPPGGAVAPPAAPPAAPPEAPKG